MLHQLLGKTMGLAALAGLASEGASQIIKKISGGQIFQVPNQHLYKLAMMDDLLTKGQIRDLAKAYTDNADMMFKVTNKQVGNGIGSILATIGIPMIIDALKGKGVGSGGPRLNKSGGVDHRLVCIHLLSLAHGLVQVAGEKKTTKNKVT